MTQADLPPGYAPVPVSPDGDDDSPVQGTTPECTARFAVLDENETDAVRSAEVAFENESSFAQIEHSWEAYESSEKLASDLTAIESAFRDCPVIILEEEGERIQFDVRPMTGAQPVGDRTAAYVASGTLSGVAFEAVLHFSIVGNHGQSVLHFAVGSADQALVQRIAALGVDRLEP